jgi:cobaltochelatase CobT
MRDVLAQDLFNGLQKSIHTSLINAGVDVGTLDVFAKGNTAGTIWNYDQNGKLHTNITFPFLPATALLKRFEADIFHGYAIHEMGHNLYTDIAVWKDAVAQKVSRLVNCFEDPRQEREIIAKHKFGNAKKSLTALTVYCANKGVPAISDLRNWGYLVNLKAYHSLYGCLPKIEVSINTGAREVDVEVDGETVTAEAFFNLTVQKIEAATGVADILEIASWFRDIVGEQELPELPELPQGNPDQPVDDNPDDTPVDDNPDDTPVDDNPEGDDDDDGRMGNPDKPVDDNPEGDDDDGRMGNPDKPVDDNPDKPSDDKVKEGEGCNPNAPKPNPLEDDQIPEDTGRDITDLVDQIKDRTQSDVKDWYGKDYTVGIINPAKIFVVREPLPTRPTYKRWVKQVNKIRQEMLSQTAVAKNKLGRLLTNPDRHGVKKNQEAGRLDQRKLTALRRGSTTVFNKRWKKDGYKTCVSILCDISSSMSPSQIHAVKQFATVIGDALEEASVPFNLISFPTIEARRYELANGERAVYLDGNGKPEDARPYGNQARHGATLVEGKTDTNNDFNYERGVEGVGGSLLKGFNQNWKARCGFITKLAPNGGTPLEEALAWAGLQIRKREEKRKVVIVLTDGGVSHICASITELLEKWGVETVGVGIGLDVSHVFKVAVDRAHGSELSTRVLDTLIAESQKHGQRIAA